MEYENINAETIETCMKFQNALQLLGTELQPEAVKADLFEYSLEIRKVED